MAEVFQDTIIQQKLQLQYMVKGDLLAGVASDSTILPIGLNGQVLRVDSTATTGMRWGSPFIDFVSVGVNTGATIISSSLTFQTALTLNTPACVSTNRYKVGWFYEWQYSTNTQASTNGFRAQVIFGTNVTLQNQYMLPHYSAVDNIPISGFQTFTGASGVNTVTLQFCTGVAGQTSTIGRRYLEFYRVS